MSTHNPQEGYPKLLRQDRTEGEFIILVYGKTSAGYMGMVLRNDSDLDYPVGTYCDTWNDSVFEEMTNET